MEKVTQLLDQIDRGDRLAAEDLFVLIYEELRKLAAVRLRHEPSVQTLQPTALVHEVFLRLVKRGGVEQGEWKSVGHFFGAASQAMRRILSENARHQKSEKLGGGAARRLDLDVDQMCDTGDDDRLLSLDVALEELEKLDPVKAKLVVLRYFGGLTIEQACEVLNISRTTAFRYWDFARAWLYQRLRQESSD
jgi:RNA polymerase sigma factor (TIGR02999 family)